MSRLLSPLVASVTVMVMAAAAHADGFGGWQYTVPKGYTAQPAADHVSFTRVRGSSFCSIALFEARRLDRSVVVESSYEWHNIVTHSFEATILKRDVFDGADGAKIAATTATLRDEEGTAYAGIHYVVMPPEMIGSVLVTASSAATLRGCRSSANAFVRDLTIDWSSPRFSDPEARVETPVGRWASGMREYTFAADGTYRYYAEEVVPRGLDRVYAEAGRYSIKGNQLTLVPTRSTITVLASGVATSTRRASLDKRTVTWSKLYKPDTDEWSIVLTPKKGSASRFSDRESPAWKYLSTGPGA